MAALLISASLTGVAASASAQVATVPEPITATPFTIRRPPADLERLTTLYNASDWNGLQALARELICVARRNAAESIGADDQRDYESCGGSTGARAAAAAADATSRRLSGSMVADALDLGRNHVALMWVAQDAFGKPQLIRVVVNGSDAPDYRVDLPGLSASRGRGQLVELFLSRSPHGRVTSLYTSTREDDPLLATLPVFAKALAGPLFAAVGSIAGSIPQGVRGNLDSVPRPKLAATVNRVGLPFRRAAIRLQAIAREPVSAAAFAASARRLASSVTFNDVPRASCGRRLAATLAAELPSVSQMPACSAAAADPLDCASAFDTALSTSFTEAVASCEGAKSSAGERDALELVDAKFRELVREGASTIAELDLKFKNRPLSRFGFGAGSGVVAHASLTRPRVTTKDGVLVADPLDRVMTTAFVNASLAGYDSENPHISAAERFRPFLGAALTPDFGPAFGVNVLLVRGIGIAAGGAILFGKGAARSDIGKEPPEPDDPYKLSVARAVFVGISYNYK